MKYVDQLSLRSQSHMLINQAESLHS